MSGLIVDNFAGGGGASTGIEAALNRAVDIAVNHDRAAIDMHRANHPETHHLCEDVYDVHPREACAGKAVDVAWFSPDCKHFSRAKGGKPVDKKIRGLAWVVITWAREVMPRVIFLENVPEFLSWGPLGEDNKPIKARAGEEFVQWKRSLQELGYVVDHRILVAADYGAPTIRKRLYLVARCDGHPIEWPKPSHRNPKLDSDIFEVSLPPWRTAAECIDWSLKCPSIFERKTPLKEKTMQRIARGLKRYVLDAKEPFIVSLTHQGGDRVESLRDPLKTATGANRGEKALVVPYVAGLGGRQGQSPERSVDSPFQTITAKADSAVVVPHLTIFRGGATGSDLAAPMPTVTAGGEMKRPAGAAHALGIVEASIAPFITEHANASNQRNIPVDEPLRTQCAEVKGGHFAVVAPILASAGGPEYSGKPKPVDEPFGTLVAENHRGIVSAFLAKHFSGPRAGTNASDLNSPTSTATATDHQSLVAANLLKLRNNQFGSDVRESIPTLTAGGGHVAEVRAFLMKYYGNEKEGCSLLAPMHTVTSKDRLGLVIIHGVDYQIVDIGMRMLSPRELARAQGFPESYILTGTKTNQVARIGNSVCPPVAEALVRANCPWAIAQEATA